MKIYFILFTLLAGMFVSCQESLDERFEREAEEITMRRCSQMIADNTRLDSITYKKKTRTIHYYYTLFGAADNKRNVSFINAHEALLKELANSTAMKTHREHGCTFEYTFRSATNEGSILQYVKLTPSDYQ